MPLIEIALLVHTAAVAVAGGLSALALSYSIRTSEEGLDLTDYLMLVICINVPVANIAFIGLIIRLLIEYSSEYKY